MNEILEEAPTSLKIACEHLERALAEAERIKESLTAGTPDNDAQARQIVSILRSNARLVIEAAKIMDMIAEALEQQ